MCRRITCPQCDKPSFAGCGLHIESVLGDVPREQRCRCKERDAASDKGKGPTRTEPRARRWWPF